MPEFALYGRVLLELLQGHLCRLLLRAVGLTCQLISQVVGECRRELFVACYQRQLVHVLVIKVWSIKCSVCVIPYLLVTGPMCLNMQAEMWLPLLA